jgi:hypothetical protein
VQGAVTTLDLAAARAAHLVWLGACIPTLLPPEECCTMDPAVQIDGIQHPLLLQPALPPLPTTWDAKDELPVSRYTPIASSKTTMARLLGEVLVVGLGAFPEFREMAQMDTGRFGRVRIARIVRLCCRSDASCSSVCCLMRHTLLLKVKARDTPING